MALTNSKPPYGRIPSFPAFQVLKFSHVFLLGGGYDAADSARRFGGAGEGAVVRLIGTPPPLPRGALVSFPLAWNLVFSLPPVDTSETEAEPPPEDCAGRPSEELL
jgi:hypothetical protein